MVLPDSHEISRAPCYLGSPPGGHAISPTGLPPCIVRLSMRFGYDAAFSLPEAVSATSRGSHNPANATPDSFHTPTVWPHPLSLATTHGISLPAGTEMFHFPAFPPHTLYIQVRVTGHDPSRVPPFGHPRITARLPAPRGFSQATTSFFGSWCQGIHPVPLQTSTTLRRYQEQQSFWASQTAAVLNIYGCSRPLYSSQATDGLTGCRDRLPPPPHLAAQAAGGSTAPMTRVQDPDHAWPAASGPNSVLRPPAGIRGPGPTPTARKTRAKGAYWGPPAPADDHSQCSTHEQPPPARSAGAWPPGHHTHPQGAHGGSVELLRKEVIQPHLPVRLPCYDLVPIAGPTFDHSLPQGVGPWASGVTNFRDLTGGVYKARERIHRSVADLRLLATPTSWGRVADPNPN